MASIDAFLQTVIRSDGALNNGIVTYDSLSPDLQTAGLKPADPWASGFSYSVKTHVIINNGLYRALVAHTSGVFATDLAAGKWLLIASLQTGPAAWGVPAAWATTTAYTAGPPASVVVQGGETYVCLVSHVAGTFAADLAAAKWIKVAQKGDLGVFRPEDYGGGPLVADNAPAFAAMCTAIRANGGGVVELQPGKTYQYFPANVAAGFYTICDLSNTRGIVWNQNGAKIATPINFDPAGGANPSVTVIFLSFSESHDIEVNDLYLEQTNYTARAPITKIGTGTIAVSLLNHCTGIRVNNIRMTGGTSAIWFVRTNGLAQANRGHGLVVNNADLTNVFYPFSFQKNGDQVLIRGARTKGAFRCYFPYNVHQHDVEIESDADGAGQDVEIANSYLNTEDTISNTTSDIRIKYTCVANPPVVAPNAYLCITFQSGVIEGFAAIRNIDMNVYIDQWSSGAPTPALIVLNQTTTATAARS
jgi:hypothetical protein